MSENLQIVVGVDIQNLTNGLQQAQKATQDFGKTTKQVVTSATPALNSLGMVARDLPFGFIAIQNNLPIVFDQFGALVNQSGSLGGAFKALGASLIGPAGITFAIGAIIAGVTALIQKYGSLGKAVDALLGKTTVLSAEQKRFNENYKSSIESVGSEASRVSALVSVINSEVETRQRKNAALKELKSISPEYFGSLNNEKSLIDDLNFAYKGYIDNLFLTGKSKAAQKQIEDLFVKLLEVEKNLKTNELAPVVDPNFAVKIADLEAQLKSLGYTTEQANKAWPNIPDNVNKLLTSINNLKQGVRTFDINGVTTQLENQKNAIIKQILALQTYVNTFDTKLSFDTKTPKLDEVFTPLKGTLQTVERTSTAFKEYINSLNILPKAAQNLKITKGLQVGLNEETQNAVDILKFYQEEYKKFANTIISTVSPSIDNFFTSIENGQNIFQALGNSLRQLVIDIVKTIAKAAILAAILNLIFPIGSKGATLLNNASGGFKGFFGSLFGLPNLGKTAAPSIGGMGGMSGGMQLAGNVVFVQRGYDLVGVLNAANGSINNIG